MKTAAEILHEHGITLHSHNRGRYYTTCPRCSASRLKEHRANKVLGITIDCTGVQWGCNHCAWTGGGYYNGKANGKGNGQAGDIIATYDYVDETGAMLFQVCRKANKEFPQRRPDGKGGWIWNTTGVRKVLYRLPELIEAIAAGHPILIVEGEKDANAAWRIGLPATCNPGGASQPGKRTKWRKEYSETLRGADVIILPDNDDAGRAHADEIARMSTGVAKRIRALELAAHWPEVAAKKGGDLSDGLAAGHKREEVDALIEAAPDYVAGEKARTTSKADGEDAIALRFAEQHAYDLRYVDDWGRWLRWDGMRWSLDRNSTRLRPCAAHMSGNQKIRREDGRCGRAARKI